MSLLWFLRREFSKCIGDLQDNIKKTSTLSSDMFTEAIERFQQFRSLTQRFDDTFFLVLSLNLGAALGMLCSSIYTIYIGEATYERKRVQLGVSLATLVVLLPPLAALHSKVIKYQGVKNHFWWLNLYTKLTAVAVGALPRVGSLTVGRFKFTVSLRKV